MLEEGTPPSSIPQQTKVESDEPKATSGPGGGNISVSAIFYISWHPQFPTQIPWLVRRNNQLPTTTTDHTERAKRVRGGRGEWEGGDLSWKWGVPADIGNCTHRNISPPMPRGSFLLGAAHFCNTRDGRGGGNRPAFELKRRLAPEFQSVYEHRL